MQASGSVILAAGFDVLKAGWLQYLCLAVERIPSCRVSFKALTRFC